MASSCAPVSVIVSLLLVPTRLPVSTLLIVAAVYMPLTALMVMLPLLGLVLNGTSSVLYGAVPDLAGAGKREQAFAMFYTGTIGGGALAPMVFGGVGDALGVPVAVMVLAGVLLVTLPLAWGVQRGTLK